MNTIANHSAQLAMRRPYIRQCSHNENKSFREENNERNDDDRRIN